MEVAQTVIRGSPHMVAMVATVLGQYLSFLTWFWYLEVLQLMVKLVLTVGTRVEQAEVEQEEAFTWLLAKAI